MQALPFIAAGASILKGVGGLAAGKENGRRLDSAAREKRRAAAEQGSRIRVDARRKHGELLANLAGGGLMGASAGGTALDLLRESQLEEALDVMELRRQGEFDAQSYEAEARGARRRGKFDLLEGVLGGASTFIGMQSDWAQARKGDSGGGE